MLKIKDSFEFKQALDVIKDGEVVGYRFVNIYKIHKKHKHIGPFVFDRKKKRTDSIKSFHKTIPPIPKTSSSDNIWLKGEKVDLFDLLGFRARPMIFLPRSKYEFNKIPPNSFFTCGDYNNEPVRGYINLNKKVIACPSPSDRLYYFENRDDALGFIFGDNNENMSTAFLEIRSTEDFSWYCVKWFKKSFLAKERMLRSLTEPKYTCYGWLINNG